MQKKVLIKGIAFSLMLFSNVYAAGNAVVSKNKTQNNSVVFGGKFQPKKLSTSSNYQVAQTQSKGVEVTMPKSIISNTYSSIKRRDEVYISAAFSAAANSYSASSSNQKSAVARNMIKGNNIMIEGRETELDAIPQKIEGAEISNTNLREQLNNKLQEAFNLGSQISASIAAGGIGTPQLASLQLQEENLQENIKSLQNKILSTTEQIASYKKQMQKLQQQVKELQNTNALLAETAKQIEGMKDDANNKNFTGYVGLGLAKYHKNLAFGGELGINFGKEKIGSNAANELEVRSSLGIALTGKLGYLVAEDSMVYVNLGFEQRKYDLKFSVLEGSGNTQNLIFGIGFEKRISQELGVYAEINNVSSIKGINFAGTNQSIALSARQLKVGVRYYIDLDNLI